MNDLKICLESLDIWANMKLQNNGDGMPRAYSNITYNEDKQALVLSVPYPMAGWTVFVLDEGDVIGPDLAKHCIRIMEAQ